MITPAERVIQAVEENYQVIPHIQVVDAEAALTAALTELMTALGWCPDCWGRGYILEQPADQNVKLPLCYCERGEKIQKILQLGKDTNADIFVPRP